MRALSRQLLLLATLGATSSFAQTNIVLILADDLGWNDVGYHGSEIRTPHLDALAASGMRLEQFHTQPTCTPTRAALMTGKSPQRLGIYRQFAKYATAGLPVHEKTLADYLQLEGYQTWLVGKWHLGYAHQKYHPNARGFDHFYGHVTGGVGYWDHVHGGGYDWQRNGHTARDAGYATHLLTDEAVNLIEGRDPRRPFFLYASFNAPHLPNEAPAAAIASYNHIADPLRRTHAAMVTELDTAVGRLVTSLKSAGIYEDTLIWFLSDNGGLNPQAFADSGLVDLARNLENLFGVPLPITILEFIRTNTLKGGSDNRPLRHGKGSIYEGGVRVPALVHWPGTLEAGSTDEFLTVQDVLPTVLDAIDAPLPIDLDGRSRLPVLKRETATPPGDYVTVGQGGEQAYYQWPWKLIALPDALELYHLERDPLETNNIAAVEAERVAKLSALLESLPRAPSLHIPLYKVFWDPDFFGGEEDRPPWSERTVRDTPDS